MTKLWNSLPGLFLALALPLSLTAAHAARVQDAQPSGPADPASTLGDITVKSTSIAEIDSAHVRIAVDLVATPKRGATLENLRVVSLRLNGLPVYAEPLTQALVLAKGVETALPPIYVTVQVRDLTSVQPLREMIEKQSVHVQGQAIASVKMSFLEKLALHTEHPRVSAPISQDVPVSFGSTPFARQAALGVLTLIEVGLQGRPVTQVLPGYQSPWLHDLEAQANANLMQIETSYNLREHDTNFPVVLDQLGFRLSTGQILTTAEVKEPWAYDADFLGRIKSGEAKLDKKSVEVQIRSLHSGSDPSQAGASPLLLTHRDFTLDVLGNPDKDDLIVPKTPKALQSSDPQDDAKQKEEFAKVNVRRRASPNAMAVIVLQAPPPAGGFHAAPAAVMQQNNWEKVALFRMTLDAQNRASIEAIEISAHRDGQGIHLDEPVDPSFFGSPIMVPEGVLGIVQDEQAGAFLPPAIATAAADAAAGNPATPVAVF